MKKFILIFLLLFSLESYADLSITEIMYDQEGGDEGREWIEIYNNGDPLDITKWYLLEADSYHGLHSEDPILGSGEYAVIVQDLSISTNDIPSAVKKIKSSFSLSNTGERLVLANADRDSIDSVEYSSEDGGSGNSNSLHRKGSSFIESSPSPGSAISASSNSSSKSSSSKTETKSKKEKKSTFEPYYDIDLGFEGSMLANSDLIISAEVFHQKSKDKKVKKLRGFYLVNFGDGVLEKYHRSFNQKYRYKFPGEYIINFYYYSSELAYESGAEALAHIEKSIHIQELDVLIDVNMGALRITNNSADRLWLDSWSLVHLGNSYIFPKHSYVSGKSSLQIPLAKLSFVYNYKDLIVLLNDVDDYIASYSRTSTISKKAASSPESNKLGLAIKTKEKDHHEEATLPDIESHVPNYSKQDQELDQSLNQSSSTKNIYLYILAIVSLLMIFFSGRKLISTSVENEDIDKEYTIEEIE